MVRKRVKGLDLGTETPHIKLSCEAAPSPSSPPAMMIYRVSQKESATSLFLFFSVADVVT